MEIAQTTSQSSFFGFGIPVIIASYHDGDLLFFLSPIESGVKYWYEFFIK